jgi:hypothetical protein
VGVGYTYKRGFAEFFKDLLRNATLALQEKTLVYAVFSAMKERVLSPVRLPFHHSANTTEFYFES